MRKKQASKQEGKRKGACKRKWNTVEELSIALGFYCPPGHVREKISSQFLEVKRNHVRFFLSHPQKRGIRRIRNIYARRIFYITSPKVTFNVDKSSVRTAGGRRGLSFFYLRQYLLHIENVPSLRNKASWVHVYLFPARSKTRDSRSLCAVFVFHQSFCLLSKKNNSRYREDLRYIRYGNSMSMVP